MRKAVAMAAGAALMVGCVIQAYGAESLSPGDAAPAFSLQDQTGKTVSLSDYAGKMVVLEWTNPGCPFVQRHYAQKTMTTLAGEYKDKGVVWLAINSTSGNTAAENLAWAKENSVQYPILTDAQGTTGKAYAAKSTPDMFVIDKAGKIAYEGAIDNDPTGRKGPDRVNYVKQALDELLAGQTVTVPKTKSYGCGVKYAN